LNAEFEKLKEKKLQAKTKFQVREQTWLDKMKQLKSDFVKASEEIQELNGCLNSYADQFEVVKGYLVGYNGPDVLEHPLPFVTMFNNLYARVQQLSDECFRLERETLDKNSALDEKCKELSRHIHSYENLGLEHSETREKLERITNDRAELEYRVRELEKELIKATDANVKAKETMKMVIQKTAHFIASDME
jgi:chromosome segregation ATPase